MSNVFNAILKESTPITSMSAVTLDRLQERAIEEFKKARSHTCDLLKMLAKKNEGQAK